MCEGKVFEMAWCNCEMPDGGSSDDRMVGVLCGKVPSQVLQESSWKSTD